jgi:hypothetical protein
MPGPMVESDYAPRNGPVDAGTAVEGCEQIAERDGNFLGQQMS